MLAFLMQFMITFASIEICFYQLFIMTV